MRAVLLIALVALFAVSQASGFVWTQTFSAPNAPTFLCNSTAQPVYQPTNYTNGVCQNQTGASYQYYCTGSGTTQNVLVYSYSAQGCAASTLTSVSQIPTVCGAGSSSSRYQCDGSDTMTFPPAGYSVSTVNYNNTFNGLSPNGVGGAGESTGSCQPVASIPNKVSAQIAYPPTKCTSRPAGASQTPVYSTNYFCKSGVSWTANYLSTDCTGTLVVLSQLPAPVCTNGATPNCGADNLPPSPPTNLGGTTATAIKYAGAVCGVATVYSQQWFSADCVDSNTIQCVNNGTASAVAGSSSGWNIRVANYGGAATAGACVTLSTPAVGKFNPEYKNTTGQCDSVGTGYVQSYSCSGGSTGTNPNSASSASVSIVALVIAAFIALISQ